MANKAALFPFIILGLVAILGCGKLTQLGNGEPKVDDSDSKSFKAAGKEWASFDLAETDVRVDLPGRPSDKTPPLPPNAKAVFSAMRIHAYDDRDFSAAITELVPTGKKNWLIKDLADTSMASLKKQIPDLTYTLDIKSETNAKYNGSFTRNGKSFDLRGCCVYKPARPGRVWAVLTLYPRDNVDAQAAGQRVIDSVVFKNSSEECK